MEGPVSAWEGLLVSWKFRVLGGPQAARRETDGPDSLLPVFSWTPQVLSVYILPVFTYSDFVRKFAMEF